MPLGDPPAASIVSPFSVGGAQQGWQCPCCGRCYSPMTAMCFYCPGAATVAGESGETKSSTPNDGQLIGDRPSAGEGTAP